MDNIQLLHGDCIELMSSIEAGSIDMILCDLPYGALSKQNKHTKWDTPVDLTALWKEYSRIIKPNGAIVLFGIGAFTASLIKSNQKMFRYTLVWDKARTTGFLNAKRMPLRRHEDIAVFYKRPPTYNPQMEKREPGKRNHDKGKLDTPHVNSCYGGFKEVQSPQTDEKYPTSIITIPKEHSVGKMFHPTQKPVALLEYLIRTYTNAGDTVLDNCMGGGSTGVACINTGRKFIGMEMNDKYYDAAVARIVDAANRRPASE